jgi:hypothetical protein
LRLSSPVLRGKASTLHGFRIVPPGKQAIRH